MCILLTAVDRAKTICGFSNLNSLIAYVVTLRGLRHNALSASRLANLIILRVNYRAIISISILLSMSKRTKAS
jgi:hypothetical protein